MTNLYDSTKSVLGESPKSPSNDVSPRDPKGASKLKTDALFKKKIDKIAADAAARSSVLREKVGYDFSGNLATVIDQRLVEVSYGRPGREANLARGLKKRYKIRVPVSR